VYRSQAIFGDLERFAMPRYTSEAGGMKSINVPANWKAAVRCISG
jgi:hypothetical protein